VIHILRDGVFLRFAHKHTHTQIPLLGIESQPRQEVPSPPHTPHTSRGPMTWKSPLRAIAWGTPDTSEKRAVQRERGFKRQVRGARQADGLYPPARHLQSARFIRIHAKNRFWTQIFQVEPVRSRAIQVEPPLPSPPLPWLNLIPWLNLNCAQIVHQDWHPNRWKTNRLKQFKKFWKKWQKNKKWKGK